MLLKLFGHSNSFNLHLALISQQWSRYSRILAKWENLTYTSLSNITKFLWILNETINEVDVMFCLVDVSLNSSIVFVIRFYCKVFPSGLGSNPILFWVSNSFRDFSEVLRPCGAWWLAEPCQVWRWSKDRLRAVFRVSRPLSDRSTIVTKELSIDV